MTGTPFGFDDIAEQAWLLLDSVRVSAYARAIRETVTPDDVVVDVGTGSGVLAVLAAKAGARKVYAIERGGVADLAQRVFRDNGVSDRIELLRMDARDARFAEPPTVIVTETLGALGIEEDIVALLKLLRARCTPDVKLIPHVLRLYVAPLSDPSLADSLKRLDEQEGVSLAQVRERVTQRVSVRRVPAAYVAGRPTCFASHALAHDSLPHIYGARLVAARSCEINALATWFEADLAPGVTLTNAPDAPWTSWTQLTLPLDPPLVVTEGSAIDIELAPRVTSGRNLYRWTAELADDPQGERREGDSLRSAGGSLADFARQLGLEITSGERLVGSPRLDAWNALSEGNLRAPLPTIDALAARLLAAMPERYADLGDAREEVLSLLEACDALQQ
jgi:predicted RNA methylase